MQPSFEGRSLGCYTLANAGCRMTVLRGNSMNVSLTPELERFLNEQVRSGRYSSKEEAVGKAVELLKEMEEAEGRLETLLPEAEDSGPATEMTAQDWGDIENEGLKRLRSRKST
jgi:antitoxin ParD1/3/4